MREDILKALGWKAHEIELSETKPSAGRVPDVSNEGPFV